MDDKIGQRLAVVDCGTNTFTLHIADVSGGQWRSVFRQRRFVRLGLDSFRSGRLSPQRLRRGLDVLKSFADTACNFNVDKVRAFGCSAIRDAANGTAFVQAAAELGWRIEVLDGDAEAEWIHLGVADSVLGREGLPDALLTVDIGGGSVELIHWTPEQVLGAWSLDLGVARLTDWIKPSDPLNAQDVESIHKISAAAVDPVVQALEQRPPQWLVGTSGAFNSLMALEHRDAHWRDARVADEFSKAALVGRCEALSTKSRTELFAIEGMHPDRVPYISLSCALIVYLLDRFNSVERVFRSRHTLAEGVLSGAAADEAQSLSQDHWDGFVARQNARYN